ncbi:Arsenite methyltransferase [Seminavis robusta]|uniref:Arsenite methyltransferase n=1 Tax=Seminavis robusta TaxID=568900 RepID=A0A9N8DKZ9_9STRA|nr:Arsenite methyltransferase [Seminavis robusta]|eukprot:Sro213_g088320.1 Arsenite methyltransferase (203) ;mRNA; f:12814-13422
MPLSVQDHYTKYVTSGGDGPTVLKDRAASLGYEAEWLRSLDDPSMFQASCGSGCPLRLPGGCPTQDALVMDLGCGAGHDVLLAAALVAAKENAKVVGVDFTPAMLEAARTNLTKHPTLEPLVELVEASLEDNENNLAKYHGKVDLVISNGVFNLCRDKAKAFTSVYKLLKPGGRFVFSDVMSVDRDPNAQIATSINGDVFSS